MNGIMLTAIYFFGNILATYLFNNMVDHNMNQSTYNIILYNWLGINSMINICKCVCYYKKETIYNGTLYLVNKSISIWTTSYPFYMVLPWNFIILMFINYSSYVDREYINIIDTWDKIITGKYYYIYIYGILYGIYNCIDHLFIFFALAGQIINTSLFFNITRKYNVLILLYIIATLYQDIMYNYIIYFIMSSQILETLLYLKNYYYQTSLSSSLNMNSIDFKCGKLFINRPFIYFNLMWIVVPLYILYNL